MRAIKLVGLCGIILLMSAALVEHFNYQASVSTMMGAIDPRTVVLKPAPIPSDWITEGHPIFQTAEVAHTGDRSTRVYVWSATAGRFNWAYDSDEVATILDGEVFVTDEAGVEHRFGPGDVAFFPYGAKARWRVPDHVRKIAILKRPMPSPIASVIRWGHIVRDWVTPTQAVAFN